MNILFFGTPDFVIPVIDLLRLEHNILTLVTTPDQKVGRKQLLTSSPVKSYGNEQGIPVITPEKLDRETAQTLKKLSPDLIIVASYGKIIPQQVLEIPKFGALNIHPSLLPKFRGASPIPATILHGDSIGGVTIIQMDEELDHGPIIAQKTYEIMSSDTTEGLLPVLFQKGAELLSKVLTQYVSGNLQPVPQNHAEATFCGRFTKEDAYIDPINPPEREIIDRMIRAYTPWPIAWTRVAIHGEEVRIKLFPEGMLQVEGKNKMTTKEFFNGYPELRSVFTRLLPDLS